MKYFYYINFSEIEDDPVKTLSGEVAKLKKPLVRSVFLRNKKEVVESFRDLDKALSAKNGMIFITVFNGFAKVLPLIQKLTNKNRKIHTLTVVSPPVTVLKKTIPSSVDNFIVFEKPSEKGKSKFKVDINTTQARVACVNDADFLVNSKAIKTQQIEFVKRLP